MRKAVTIYDIAKALQLTPSSVSRALRDHPDISADTKRLVTAAAKKMRYKTNIAAANLRTGRSTTLGIVVPEINNQFFSNVIAGIEEVAHQKGYHLLICQTNEGYEKEVENVNLLINQNVAGIFISLSKTTAGVKHLREAQRHQIPVVQFDRTEDSLKCLRIENDNIEATTEAVRHLHRQGYRRIAFLAGPRSVPIFEDRFTGFKKGLKELGLTYHEELVAFDCLTNDKAKEKVLEFLNAGKRPDAVLACADLAALGAMEAARQKKLSIPGDIGICGYSNEPYTQWTSPTLTTVNQNSIEIGRRAMNAFLEAEEGKKAAKQQSVLVKSALVVRESTLRKK